MAVTDVGMKLRTDRQTRHCPSESLQSLEGEEQLSNMEPGADVNDSIDD